MGSIDNSVGNLNDQARNEGHHKKKKKAAGIVKQVRNAVMLLLECELYEPVL